MRLKGAKIAFRLGVLALSFLLPNLSCAQAAVLLSGTVLDPAGRVVSSAKISIKNLQTGKSSETESNSAGLYNVPNLTPGDYEVSVSAEGLATKVARVTVTAGKQQTLNVSLNTGSAQQEIPADKPTAAPPANLPNAPSGSTASPSLQDLGFTPQQTQANAQLQEMLEKRTHMLKVHQTLGLITAIPMVASLITGPQAKAAVRLVYQLTGSGKPARPGDRYGQSDGPGGNCCLEESSALPVQKPGKIKPH